MKVEIDHSRCGAAGECVDVCESGVLGWGDVEVKTFLGTKKKKMPTPMHPEKCTGCMKCVNICPTKTIRVTK